MPIHAVILAGGAGERFWPASRRERPKHFLRVVGKRTLLDATLARARRVARKDRIWIVCGAEQARATRKESGLPASRVLVEPRRRNTAMAAAWAAERVRAVDPEAVMVILSADHHIPDASAFASDIKLSAQAAAEAGVLVTLGVKPSRPETGYGYIQSGPAAPGFRRLRQVKRFVEKPNLSTARRYLRSGQYRWNAGIFVFKASVFLAEVQRCAPEVHRVLAPLRGPKARTRKAIESAYRRAPSLPIDVAVMERSNQVWTLPVDFQWSDVGTWASLAEELGVGKPGRGAHGAGGNRILGGEVVIEGSTNNLVWAGDRLVALVGVEDLVVVDTQDVTFVTKLDGVSDVRRLVAKLRDTGRDELT
ncbi:MAG: mannose-1-phosphate guanylyltransferase [Myxococcota bacterium]|nr:mannose-1-phosphate guanylyltransferase [Myxococcota bacterium]